MVLARIEIEYFVPMLRRQHIDFSVMPCSGNEHPFSVDLLLIKTKLLKNDDKQNCIELNVLYLFGFYP